MLTRRQVIRTGALAGPLALLGAARAQTDTPLSPQERALHALNRLGYGPRPGDVQAIDKLGAEAWLQQFLAQQMAPAVLPESLGTRLQALPTTQLSQAELIGRYRAATSAGLAARRDAGSMSDAETAALLTKARRELVRPVLLEASSQRLFRALESPAQLEEVLVEFWFNHFNVFAGKGQVAVLVGDYERQAIRPHVLGRFRDMLGASAKHIGFKLAQAFVADQPPPALVQRLADRFTATGGDLKAVMQALIASDEFWRREAFGAKFKTPYQYLVSTLRALDVTEVPEVQPLLQVLAQSGMPLYGAQTPDGYKNTAAAWMNPEALAQRLQFASKLAERRQRNAPSDTAGLLVTMGGLWRASTRQSVASEPANLQTALLLGSPEFMHH